MLSLYQAYYATCDRDTPLHALKTSDAPKDIARLERLEIRVGRLALEPLEKRRNKEKSATTFADLMRTGRCLSKTQENL